MTKREDSQNKTKKGKFNSKAKTFGGPKNRSAPSFSGRRGHHDVDDKTRRNWTLPEVAVVQVSMIDEDGEAIAYPADWKEGEGKPPKIFLQPATGHAALGIGERALVRLKRLSPRAYNGTILRKLEAMKTARIVGLFQETPQGARVVSSDRRQKDEVAIPPSERNEAVHGELVVAEMMAGSAMGLPRGRIIERLGLPNDPHSISLIAIHTHEIPNHFSNEVIAQAEGCSPASLDKRMDIRHIPLVTIDDARARDFDDAVYAEHDGKGWKLLVAIADVSHYVHPGSLLDKSAYERGNSTYFPDRVVPMLPEALSNGLCSLVPQEDRACIACWLWVDSTGQLTRYEFFRGLMKSAARLTYIQVQNAMDGKGDELTAPLLGPVIKPLYGAFETLFSARKSRGTLELDLPEREVQLDENKRVKAIVMRERLDSHRLIEEFMITANIAAARALEDQGMVGIYRVHEPPSDAKAEALRIFLKPMGYSLPQADVLHPRLFAKILTDANTSPLSNLISTVVLRSQSQAYYGPENKGHFGLALTHYAHFTSPIRRYADLIVHRGLVAAFHLGDGGMSKHEIEKLQDISDHISSTERRSALAERDAMDRYSALYLIDHIGETLKGKVSGVTRFGIFVTLDETKVDGLVPMNSLQDDRYDHDEAHHCLVGRRWGKVYRLGAACSVRLLSADPLVGSAVFELISIEEPEENWPPVNRKPGRKHAPSFKKSEKLPLKKSGGGFSKKSWADAKEQDSMRATPSSDKKKKYTKVSASSDEFVSPHSKAPRSKSSSKPSPELQHDSEMKAAAISPKKNRQTHSADQSTHGTDKTIARKKKAAKKVDHKQKRRKKSFDWTGE